MGGNGAARDQERGGPNPNGTLADTPFGLECTGYLVTNMDEAIRAAKATGADVFVAPFNEPIGRDAIIHGPVA